MNKWERHSGEKVPNPNLKENWATICETLLNNWQMFLAKIHAESAAGCTKFLREVNYESIDCEFDFSQKRLFCSKNF